MEEVKKTKGAWVIHVGGSDVEQSIDAECTPEQADGNGPPYEPDDYVVQDCDLDSEEMDGVDDEPVLEKLYGNNGETGSTDTRRPFLNWQHIQDWTTSDWVMMQTYKGKVLAAAESGFMGVSAVSGVLAAAKGVMCGIPLPKQVELCMWATDIVNGLIFSLEDTCSECAPDRCIRMKGGLSKNRC